MHTPGPWNVKHDQGVSRVFVNTKIADVYSVAFRDVKNQEDNAALVSAAPDLLAALEAALGQTGCDGDICMYEWHEAARRAIAKAKGEA